MIAAIIVADMLLVAALPLALWHGQRTGEREALELLHTMFRPAGWRP